MSRSNYFLACFLFFSSVIFFLSGCKIKRDNVKAEETMFQVGLLQSLTAGQYDGVISVKDLAKRGDIGIGTFHAINGEMIVLDGIVYQALGDGTVVVAKDDETVPFATVTYMDVDIEVKDFVASDIHALKNELDAIVKNNSVNQFYMVRIDGKCDGVTVRSEIKQEKPYKTLDVALSTAQREFSYSDSEGTLIGLYCPPFMSMLNTPGWHFHYITGDRKLGGHVLAVQGFKGTLKVDKFSEFDVYCPENKIFDDLDLAEDQSERIKAVEQGTKN